jgi:hypothetical protein
MITRHLWKCPQCGRRWDIPAGFDPQSCPKCVPAAADSPSADAGERDLRSSSALFVGEDSTGARRPRARTVRDVEQPASQGDFFVPLSTESLGLDAAVAEEPVVLRKRKQRAEIPLGAVVACVAGCLVMVGLIVYQKTKGHAGAASAAKAVVEGQLERPGAAGTRDGRKENTAAKDHNAQLGAGNARRRANPAPTDSDEEDATPPPP